MTTENTRGEHHLKYHLKDEVYAKPMTLREIFEKVREGCECYMNDLDEHGYCEASDDYVVALAFFDDYIEDLKRNGAWE